MAHVSPARWRLLLAPLPLLFFACASSADPKQLPSWIAVYPGSHPERSGAAFIFTTKDSAEQVLNFYQGQLLQKGLHMEARGGGEYGGMLSAEDDSHRRSVMINVSAEKDASQVSITPVEK